MTFNDIFKSSFLENVSEFSILDTLIGLAVALVIGLFIFIIYKKTLTGVLYSSGFALTLVGLSLVTTLVIMAVTSNVVLSLGMVGALSIVRFRTAIKEPVEIVFLFWSLAVGIVIGAGMIPLAVIGSAIIAAGMAAAVCLCLSTAAFSGPIAAAAGETGITMAYETALFDTSSVLGVNLNNNYADATNMKETLIYDMYQYLGADASLYNYAKLSVNGEYRGVYLALEAVEDSFLLRNYGVQDGELYKPDSMNIGGGKDFGDFNADDIDFGDLDLDNLLRYMAVHIFSVNEDSLSGSMAHNYYLYEAGGKLNLIPWDYNLALGGMGRSNDATSVVNDAIDNAFSGTTFFDTLMADETCHSRYYAYLQQLVNEYIGGGGFDAFYERVRSQIDALVESDPTAFYSYDEYLTAAETLYQVVKLRGQSIQGQLDGTIPSTEAAQRTSDALVDASALDLSAMGYMNSGGGGGFDAPAASETRTAPDVSDGSEHAPPAGFDPSQFNREGQNADDPQQTTEDAPASGDAASGGRPDPGSFPGSSADASAAIPTDDLLLYALSFLPLTAALLFALLYRRRPRKQ